MLRGNLQKGYWADPPALPDLLNGYLRRLLGEEVGRLKVGVADLMREVVVHLEGVVSEQAMQAGFRHDASKADFSGRVQSARAAARCVSVNERRQEKHTCAYSLSTFLRAKTPGGWTNESKVSSRGNRHISAYVCMCVWARERGGVESERAGARERRVCPTVWLEFRAVR